MDHPSVRVFLQKSTKIFGNEKVTRFTNEEEKDLMDSFSGSDKSLHIISDISTSARSDGGGG